MLLTDEHKQKAIAAVDSTVTAYLEAIPDKVRAMLDATLINFLGLERDHWGGKFKVDHCNNNRSVVGDMVKNIVESSIDETALAKIVAIRFEEVMNNNDMIDALVTDAVSQAHYTVRSAINTAITAHIHQEVTKIVDAIVKPVQMGNQINTEAADPKSFGSKLGQFILEKLVAKQPAKKVTCDTKGVFRVE